MDKKKFNYKIICSYDGTNYSGWQIQPNATSIQSLIQAAIQTVIREEITLIGAGRTDAGVHALGQVAHFHTYNAVDLRRLLFALNGMLPKDIRIQNILQVPFSFHSQYSATGKIYHYHFALGPIVNPMQRLYVAHIQESLDMAKMRAAAPLFVGTHDFTSFANSASEGSASKNAVRTLYRLDIVEEPGGYRLEFEGNGFLYKMVRNITGTLLDIASGKKAPEEIPCIFASKDRRLAGRSAPASGLFLLEVHYLK